MSDTETVICTFRVKPTSLGDFLSILERHWPKLHELGLVTDQAEQSFVSQGAESDHPTVVSVFEWINGDASERADVAEIWDAMEPLCESRHGRPSMEFPHFQPLARST